MDQDRRQLPDEVGELRRVARQVQAVEVGQVQELGAAIRDVDLEVAGPVDLQQHHAQALGPGLRDHVVDVPLDAPAPAVRHVQQRPAGEVPGQPRPVEPRPPAPAGIGLDELADPGRIVGVLGEQRRLALVVLAARVEPERDLAGMVDEHVLGEQVDEAGLDGAQAPVVLLAVALAEGLGVEVADGVEGGGGHVHAEADAGGHGHGAAAIDLRGHAVEVGPGDLERHGVVGVEARVGADRGVVGQGRDAAHGRARLGGGSCLRLSVGDEAVEPVAEDFSVGVEQDDGAALAQAEGAVDRADEAEVALVLDEVEQAAAGEGGEVRGELRVGGAVVDGEQGEGGGLGRRQAGVEGAQGLAAALVDGDDDDDAGLRDGQGPGQAVPFVGRRSLHGRVGAEILGAAHQPGGPAGAHVVQERRLPGTQQVPVGLPVERDREGLARVPALVLPVGDEVGERASAASGLRLA